MGKVIVDDKKNFDIQQNEKIDDRVDNQNVVNKNLNNPEVETLDVNLETKDEDKGNKISIIRSEKSYETNACKIAVGHGAIMAGSALLGFSNPIGLLFSVALMFKKLSVKRGENFDVINDFFTNNKPVEINVDIVDNENKEGLAVANMNSGAALNKRIVCCNVSENKLDQIAKLFTENEQRECAKTNKLTLNQEQADELCKILKCETIGAGEVDFGNNESLNKIFGKCNLEIIDKLKKVFDSKAVENSNVPENRKTSNKVIVRDR